MNKVEFLARIRAKRARLDVNLAPMSEEQLTRRSSSTFWSVKDALAHLTFYEQHMLNQVRLPLKMVLAPLWLDDPRLKFLPQDVDEESFSIDFYDRPLGEGLDRYLDVMPVDCTVRRADRELIMRTEWGPGDVAYHGGLDAWERKCICFCLMREEDILSEASVGPGVDGLRELGVFTQEAHRGKGYGTLVSAHLIHHLEGLGERTYWSCDSENYASAGIGRKLGYRVEKPFRVLAWGKIS